jgi:hypothetical protein
VPQILPFSDCSNSNSRRWNSDHAIEQMQKKLFDLQQELYDEGARNFLFIDVPPMETSPACEPIPSSPTQRTLSTYWMPQFRRTLGHWLARLTKGGIKYFGGLSKLFYRKTKMSQQWSYLRGTFSSSSSKRLPSTVLKRRTSANGTDPCGLTTSTLPAVCTSSLLRGSTNSFAVTRLVRVLNPIDSHVVHNGEVKYHCI